MVRSEDVTDIFRRMIELSEPATKSMFEHSRWLNVYVVDAPKVSYDGFY